MVVGGQQEEGGGGKIDGREAAPERVIAWNEERGGRDREGRRGAYTLGSKDTEVRSVGGGRGGGSKRTRDCGQ